MLLGDDGRARLVDFGFAARAAVDAPELVGTPAYAAPEQDRPAVAPRGRADGPVRPRRRAVRGPHRGAALRPPDPGEVVRLHATAPVPDPRDLAHDTPAALATVVVKLLAKDPDDRYQSAPSLRDDLGAVHRGHGLARLDAGSVGRAVHDPPLAGRSAELAHLRDAWRDAAAGRGRALLLTGPSGAGKSRLAREGLRAARPPGPRSAAPTTAPARPGAHGAGRLAARRSRRRARPALGRRRRRPVAGRLGGALADVLGPRATPHRPRSGSSRPSWAC
ncbi:MAG: AAA family ATPase [Myxococcota bacterium]